MIGPSIYWNDADRMKKRQKKKQDDSQRPTSSPGDSGWSLIRWHSRVGWWSLLLFLTLGITLEAMHGFKVQWYVGEHNSTRRLMWTLAHAHGTLLALVHLAFASAIQLFGACFLRSFRLRSWCLSMATILMPFGFFAGGFHIDDGDPGLGILLVPVGAGLLFVAVLLTALAVEAGRRPTP